MSQTTSTSGTATQDAVAQLVAALAPAVAPDVAKLLASQQQDQLASLVAGASETAAELPDAGPLANGDYAMISQKQADGSFKDVKAPLSAVAAFYIGALVQALAAMQGTAAAPAGSTAKGA